MGVKQTGQALHTCDRCGTEGTSNYVGTQPKGWARVWSEPVGHKRFSTSDVCERCVISLRQWFRDGGQAGK